MNNVAFVGRICRDILIREVNSDTTVTNNVIAVSRPYKDRNGETLTDFIPFVAWNGIAKTLKKYACKGQRIAIAGLMQSRKYVDQEKGEVYIIECNVTEMTLLDRPQKERENDTEETKTEDMQVAQKTVDDVRAVLDN